MPWDFFKSILYINLDSRFDRLIEITEEMDRVGIRGAARIPGVIAENPTRGFNQAQRNAMEAATAPVLILEDDAVFSDYSHLEAALTELPEDWDILYLGANVVGTNLCSWPEPEYVSPHLRRVTQAWTTHAVAYSEKGLAKILKEWDHTGGQIYDDYLRCNIESNLKAYIVFPMVADQRPSYSDIWKCDTHYGFFNKWSQ